MMSSFTQSQRSLKLTPKVFELLHRELIKQFSVYYSTSTKLLSEFQLYGFYHYDEKSPNMRSYVHATTNLWINGKYLYNKVRDLKNGKRAIKLTREHVYVYFLALRCKDVFAFLQSFVVDEALRYEQFTWLGMDEAGHSTSEYYVGYYCGEDFEIIKNCLTIYDNYSKVSWDLVYWEGEKEPSLYTYEGIIVNMQSTVTFYFQPDHATTERAALISVFWGNKNIVNKSFLLGTYSGFDRNDCPVAGEIIFQRVGSVQEQKELAYSKGINSVIRTEIAGKRIVTRTTLSLDSLAPSQDNMYSNSMEHYSGEYIGHIVCGKRNEDKEELQLSIEDKNNKARLIFSSGRIYNGYFRMMRQSNVLLGAFGVSLPFCEITIMINPNFHKKHYLSGTYMGVNQKNYPYTGKVSFMKKH